MIEKEYEVTVRIRNNFLLKAIKKAGFNTIAEFCRHCNVPQQSVNNYAGFKMAPLIKDGMGGMKWSNTVLNIADALHTTPETLFPPQHLTKCLKKNSGKLEFDAPELDFFLQSNRSNDHSITQTELKATLKQIIAEFPARDAEILSKRFGLDGPEQTLEQVAQHYGVGRERIRQIEQRTLRRMKHPSRSRKLLPFLTSPDYLEDCEEAVREKKEKEAVQELNEGEAS